MDGDTIAEVVLAPAELTSCVTLSRVTLPLSLI